jgi:hypothetical protein
MHRIRIIALAYILCSSTNAFAMEAKVTVSKQLIKSMKNVSTTMDNFPGKLDETLANHLPAVERIVDKVSLIIPSEQALTKWCTRGRTTSCGVLGTLLAMGSCYSYTECKKDPNKPQHYWWLGGFSALLLSAAIYLYWYEWDAHLNLLPVHSPVISPLS